MSEIPEDPFASSDATILRPRPGRRTTAQRDATPPASAPTPAAAQWSQPKALQPAAAIERNAADISREAPVVGANALVAAAAPLLMLAGRLRTQIAHPNVEALRLQLDTELRTFEERLRQAAVAADDAIAARYVLCTVLDEAVLNTPWGAQSGWAGRSLLVTFHRESSGGEKFFQILDRVMSEAPRYLGLLELLHACLALGFEGRYRLDERGSLRLAEIRQNVYRVIQGIRGSGEADLSPQWRGVQDRRNPVVRLVPLWVVAAACVALLFGAFVLFSAWLGERTEGINVALGNVGVEPLYVAAPASQAPQIDFATLLARQIAAGLVSVEEQEGGRTLITLTVPDLFASASAGVNQRYAQVIADIGVAADQVPGRLLVTGHTDDQPLRSLQYQDNYALSRARAVQVADLIRGKLRDAGRVEFTGKGSVEPRYRPESLPENRARNRRVEIVHRRDG